MKIKLANLWNKIRESYWFLPALMFLLAIGLSISFIQIDKNFGAAISRYFGWLSVGKVQEVSTRLAALSAAMIAITGVVFSITIVSLTLTSQQFGPRLLRNFLRDRVTQFVLGSFLATAMYCMVARYQLSDTFTPYLTFTFAGVLALFNAAVFIFFMHHIANSLHASNVIARISKDFTKAINEFHLDVLRAKKTTQRVVTPDELAIPQRFDEQAHDIISKHSGYIQAIDYNGLIEMARRHDLILRIDYRAGHFVIAGTTFAAIWPGKKANRTISNNINSAIYLGNERTLTQDLEFAISQLSELATRALSPGINDPFTAMGCINRLGEGLLKLAQIDFPGPYYCDRDQNLRIITKPINYPGLVNASFNLIRQNGIGQPAVMIRLLETIATISKHVSRNEDGEILRQHADMALQGSKENIKEIFDLKKIELHHQNVIQALKSSPLGKVQRRC